MDMIIEYISWCIDYIDAKRSTFDQVDDRSLPFLFSFTVAYVAENAVIVSQLTPKYCA
jgi:hypothetical protein